MTENQDPYFNRIRRSASANVYKSAFIAFSVLLFFLMPILSFDAGLTDDERVHNEHGIRLMDHFMHGDTAANIKPVDAHGVWRYKSEPENFPVFMNIYGGFFDMLSAFVYRYVTSAFMGEYESKHVMISFAGVLLFILTGLIALRLTGSWAAALLALLFAAMSPRLVGHSFDNPKDIPFAAAFAFGIYQILLVLDAKLRISWRRAILLIMAIVISIDIRIGGIMLIFYLGLFSGMYMVYEVLIKSTDWKIFIRPAITILVIAVAGYLGASIFWPWAAQNPIMNPLVSLRIFSQFSQFNSYELFEGVRINNDSIPWYFVIKWFYISFPVFLFSGFILFLLLAWSNIRLLPEKFISLLFVLTAFLLPLILVMVQKSNLYDDARHLYFVLPSFLALAAVGWYWLLKKMPGVYIWPVATICALTMTEPFLFMVRNHPHEVMYFSPLVGGVKGAFKKYEMDYWGFSLKAGLNWLDNNDTMLAKNRKTRVRLWYGEQLKVKYYTDKSKHLEYVLTGNESPDWDYWLQLPAESKYNPDLLAHWPPPNTIHEITVDNIPLLAIIRNPLSDINPGHGDPVAGMDPSNHMARGLAYYNAKDYNRAIIEFHAILKIDSMNQLAYNNLVASYNLLGMYPDAVETGQRAVKLFPDFQLLKNNLVYSMKGAKTLQLDEKYLTAASYNYFVQMEYAKCIAISELMLKLNPKNTAAYNNICASENSLGNFKAAEAACLKGLQLSPGEQLLKNNLAVSQRGMAGS